MARVVIFGASSAIATEAARLYAARGDRLHLVGRSAPKLAATVAACGPAVASSVSADFTDTARSAPLVEEAVTALGGLDVALIAHGWLGDQLATERRFEDAAAVFQANLLSAVALLIPLANHLQAQGHGKLGVITSVAGERGRPRNYTYGAAKGALGLYLQGLRSRLHGSGVTVTTLKLGPVDTPMTVDHPKNLLFGTAPGVARSIVAAVERGAAEVYVPWYWAAIMPIVRGLPEPLFQRFSFLSGR